MRPVCASQSARIEPRVTASLRERSKRQVRSCDLAAGRDEIAENKLAAEPVRHQFDDYVRYSETHSDGAFEFIDGVIFTLPPEGDAHLLTRFGIYLRCAQSLDLERYTPWTEASFPALGWADGPRPDLFVSRGPARVGGNFSKRPAASDIALVIEVSSTSRGKDKRKARVYARLGIPEYWLVDLLASVVTVYREPSPGTGLATYGDARDFARDETLTSAQLDGLTIETNFLLELAE